MKKRTTIYLDEQDRFAIATLREYYGVTSDSDVIRLALRLLTEQVKGKHEQETEGTTKHASGASLSDA
jgi:Arc/MetJ family transcription regulator